MLQPGTTQDPQVIGEPYVSKIVFGLQDLVPMYVTVSLTSGETNFP